VIHRDLNPTNVFMVDEKENKVKILDFNVSKLVDGTRSKRHSFDDEDKTQNPHLV